MWIIIGSIVLALGALGLVRQRRPRVSSDLGWVTEQWLSEHRAEQSSPPR